MYAQLPTVSTNDPEAVIFVNGVVLRHAKDAGRRSRRGRWWTGPARCRRRSEHGMAHRMRQGVSPGVSHHFHLLPEFAGKDVLRNESMDAANDVHDLGDAGSSPPR